MVPVIQPVKLLMSIARMVIVNVDKKNLVTVEGMEPFVNRRIVSVDAQVNCLHVLIRSKETTAISVTTSAAAPRRYQRVLGIIRVLWGNVSKES